MECVMTDMNGATDMMRNVMQTTQDYNAKVSEFALANCNATVAYFSKLAATKTPSDLIELTTRHVREQTETMTRQARELTEIAQKVLPNGSS
jgi:hypothetical protein